MNNVCRGSGVDYSIFMKMFILLKIISTRTSTSHHDVQSLRHVVRSIRINGRMVEWSTKVASQSSISCALMRPPNPLPSLWPYPYRLCCTETIPEAPQHSLNLLSPALWPASKTSFSQHRPCLVRRRIDPTAALSGIQSPLLI